MAYSEIENKTFAELKAEREALVEAAKAEPPEVIAARYIKILITAKQRDEALAKQGQTITALQDGLAAAKAQVETAAARTATLQGELGQCQATLDTVRETAQQTTLMNKTALDKFTVSLQNESGRANRLKAEAARNYAALSGAAKLVNDALSQHAIENADSGE